MNQILDRAVQSAEIRTQACGPLDTTDHITTLRHGLLDLSTEVPDARQMCDALLPALTGIEENHASLERDADNARGLLITLLAYHLDIALRPHMPEQRARRQMAQYAADHFVYTDADYQTRTFRAAYWVSLVAEYVPHGFPYLEIRPDGSPPAPVISLRQSVAVTIACTLQDLDQEARYGGWEFAEEVQP